MEMTKEILPPAFQILTGLSFMTFLVVMLRVRSALRGTGGVLLKLAMLGAPLGFLIMAQAGREYSLGGAAGLLLAAGACFFVSLVLMGSGMVLLVRNGPVGHASQA
jgi:hypothetical protein